MLFLSPLPPGVRGGVRIIRFLRRSGDLGRFRPRSGVKHICYCDFGPKRSWAYLEGNNRELAGRIRRLDCLMHSFRFLSLLLWFVVGPGALREGPGWFCSEAAGAPGAHVK